MRQKNVRNLGYRSERMLVEFAISVVPWLIIKVVDYSLIISFSRTLSQNIYSVSDTDANIKRM